MEKKKLVYFLALPALLLTSCGTKIHDISEYMLEMDWKDDFKILQLSDIHLANKDEQDLQLKFLDLTINDANKNNDLDLIIATGDLFTFADKTTAKTLFNFFESKKIPWTVTFGNHDEQCYFSIDWMTGLLNEMSTKKDHYCYFKDIQDDKIFGNSNFAINLMQSGKVHTQIVVMDSNRYNYGEYLGYDYIKPDQVSWFKDLADKTKTMTADQNYATSLCFFHIPVPEFETAWNLYSEGSSEVTYLGGSAGEGISCPEINSGFFDAAKERGTKGIFVGHDHVSDWALVYQGVTLSYCVTSTDRIYRDPEMMGGTTIVIHDDNTFTIDRLFHTYEEVQ